jgi:polysaccharide biosynthesis transport protein
MGQEAATLQDFLDILKRRKRSIIVTSLAVFSLSAVIAFLIPAIYRSSSTILIEEQEVPRELVTNSVTSFAEQRLQTINQRIMGSNKLLDIIARFHLYPELKEKWTTEEIVEKLRKDIKLNTISADVVDPRTGMPRPATIAFTLSYQGKNPQQVQQVAGELASLYLAENLATRERQSQGTTDFMEEEMKAVQAHLAESEAKLSAYKLRNVNALPELTQMNQQTVEQVERDILMLTEQLRGMKERESNLKSQLEAISPDAASQDKTRLSELRLRLGEMKTRYTDEHPDVIKAKSELAELIKQLRSSGRDTADNKPDNQAYITLSSQLAGVRSEITVAKRQIEGFLKKRDAFRGRIAAAPGVEEGYRTIMVDRNNFQLKYDELSKKYMDARTSHGLEKEQKGERFTLIDAARFPEKPVLPNIPVILVIGLVLGLGGGVGIAAFREQSDQAVYTPERLALATRLPVLASIPRIITVEDLTRRRTQKKRMALAVLVVLVLVPVAFQFLVMDLDVFWARALRRVAKL